MEESSSAPDSKESGLARSGELRESALRLWDAVRSYREVAEAAMYEPDFDAAAERIEVAAELVHVAQAALAELVAERVFLVEETCEGPDAAGGGCGAWGVREVRPLRAGDLLSWRASPDHERAYYENDRVLVWALWPHADRDRAIVLPRPCCSCRS